MVTKRTESSNPPQKQQPGSLETRRTVQFCQVRSLASFRGVCACCVSMSLLLSILLCADMFCCVSIFRGGMVPAVGQTKAEMQVDLDSCSYIASVPHALLRSDVWLSVHRASCFAVALVGPFLWGCFLLPCTCSRRASLNAVLLTTFSLSVSIIQSIGRFIRCGVGFLLKMLLKTASQCCVVREKTCACSTKTPPPTSRSKHVSTQSATGSVTRMLCPDFRHELKKREEKCGSQRHFVPLW